MIRILKISDRKKFFEEHELLVDIARLDPRQERFAYPVNFEIMKKDEFRQKYGPAIYKSYLNCMRSSELDLPEDVMISTMARLQPIENLTRNQENYLRDSMHLLHSNHIVHGDIKPENVMMKDGHPVFIDFGLSTKVYDERNPEKDIQKFNDANFFMPPRPKRRFVPSPAARSPRRSPGSPKSPKKSPGSPKSPKASRLFF